MLEKIRVFTKNDAIRHTFGYYLLFICLGLDLAIIGPTLPALAAQTGARVGQMGLLFLVGSIGYTLGTIISGRVFDRVRGHPVLGIAQLFAAAAHLFHPSRTLVLVIVGDLGLEGFRRGFRKYRGQTPCWSGPMAKKSVRS